MKMKDVAQKSEHELEQLITDTRAEIAKVAVDLRTKQVTNVKQTTNLKQTLARALTLQREREITKQEQAS